MQTIKFTQQYDEKYIHDFVYDYLLKNDEELVKYQKKIQIKPWILIGLVVFEAMILMATKKITQSDIVFISIFAIVLVINFFGVRLYRQRIYKQYLKAYQPVPTMIDFSIDEKGVIRQVGGKKVVRKWDKLTKACYFNNMIVLLGGSNDFAIFFDVSSLNNDQKQQLEVLIMDKIGRIA